MCCISRDGSFAVLLAGSRFLVRRNLLNGTEDWAVDLGFNCLITSLITSKDDKLIALAKMMNVGDVMVFNSSDGSINRIIKTIEDEDQQGQDLGGVDFLDFNGEQAIVVTNTDFDQIIVVSFESGEVLANFGQDGSQPRQVVADTNGNLFVATVEVLMEKWNSGELLSTMDSSPNGYGITQCVAIDRNPERPLIVGAAFAHVSVFDPDSCDVLGRFSLPGETYHIHNICAASSTIGGVFGKSNRMGIFFSKMNFES